MKKIWRPVGLVLSSCVLVSAAGCISSFERAGEYGATVYPGMSTDEVVDRLGNPDQVIKGQPGADFFWIYRYEGGPGTLATIFLVIFVVVLIVLVAAGGGGGGFGNFNCGGDSDPPYQIRIHFDRTGHVDEVSPPYQGNAPLPQ